MTQDRIEILDLTRGVAVLGILLMNIRIFAEPSVNYFSPIFYGDYSGLNRLWWDFQYFFADQKFMALFSMLFGASTALICDGLAKKGGKVGYIYGRRIFFLLLIGLIHAYLIWSGDILVFYAISSIIPFFLRNIGWKKQIAIGLVVLVLGTLNSYVAYTGISAAPESVLDDIASKYFVGVAAVDVAQIEAYRGSWPDQLMMRMQEAYAFHTDVYLSWGMFRVIGLMMLGLGLYRSGYLTGHYSGRVYLTVTVICLPLGYGMAAIGYIENLRSDWAFPAFFFKNALWNYWGSILIALGYVAVLMLAQRRGILPGLQKCIQAVGRMALSNYIFQSIICTAFFYGLGLFAVQERVWTALVVLAVWGVQITLSVWWLRYHSMGPLEKIWRHLTYPRSTSV